MGLKASFTAEDFRREIEKHAQKIENAILLQLKAFGEELVNHARTNYTFTQQTGNLVSSMGCVIVANGKVVSSYFPETKPGAADGKKLAEELAHKALKGFRVVIVAAMDYAGSVEAKGYNVLAASENPRRKVPSLVSY